MQLYLDTANIDEVRRAAGTGILDGVTTNPSWIAKEGLDFTQTIKEIVHAMKGAGYEEFTVSAEVTAADTDGMVAQAEQLMAIDPHVIIKVPLTTEGIRTVSILSNRGIRTNVTLCFSANQALLAAKAGAWCVSPFVGRLNRAGQDGTELLEEIREIYDQFQFATKILAASIHEPLEVKEAALAGADIATLMPAVFWKLYAHPLTEQGLATFTADWKAYEERR